MSEEGATNSGCTAVTAFLRLEDPQGHQSFAPAIRTLVPSSNRSSISSSRSDTGEEGNSRASTPTSSGKSKILPKKDKGPHALQVEAPRRVLYTANAGDARAVLCRQGRAVRLTYDHKGNDKKEVRRIQEAGGFVLNNRVNGVLAVTRSLGDSAMKDFVVGTPYTTEVEISDDDEFLIIACDGLWDVVEDQAAVDLIKEAKVAQDAANILLKHALDNFSHDNVTVLVVKFNVSGREESATVGG